MEREFALVESFEPNNAAFWILHEEIVKRMEPWGRRRSSVQLEIGPFQQRLKRKGRLEQEPKKQITGVARYTFQGLGIDSMSRLST
jgi:hypothetical protein